MGLKVHDQNLVKLFETVILLKPSLMSNIQIQGKQPQANVI